MKAIRFFNPADINNIPFGTPIYCVDIEYCICDDKTAEQFEDWDCEITEAIEGECEKQGIYYTLYYEQDWHTHCVSGDFKYIRMDDKGIIVHTLTNDENDTETIIWAYC